MVSFHDMETKLQIQRNFVIDELSSFQWRTCITKFVNRCHTLKQVLQSAENNHKNL